MLTKISISNFRAIGPRPLVLDLAPLTVLVGLNGTGKSSVIDALAFKLLGDTRAAILDALLFDRPSSATRIEFPGEEPGILRKKFRRIRRVSGVDYSVTTGANGTIQVDGLCAAKRAGRLWLKLLGEWAGRFGMWDIEAVWEGRSVLVTRYHAYRGSTAVLLPRNASSGSRRALLLAIQLLLTAPDAILLLEHPESQLHPRFQAMLPALFAESIKTGRQIIATTHSEVLCAALGNAVRRGLLAKDDVAIWHLEREDGGQGDVKAERVTISDKGYLEPWVPSFETVEKELFDGWYDGLPEEQPGKKGGEE